MLPVLVLLVVLVVVLPVSVVLVLQLMASKYCCTLSLLTLASAAHPLAVVLQLLPVLLLLVLPVLCWYLPSVLGVAVAAFVVLLAVVAVNKVGIIIAAAVAAEVVVATRCRDLGLKKLLRLLVACI